MTSAQEPLQSSLQLTWEQVRHARIAASGLIAPYATPAEAAHRLIGIQAQIEPAAGLALWNRTPGYTFAAFNADLYSGRSLVKLWGQRHTLHAYASTDWPLIYGCNANKRTWWEQHADQNDYSYAEYLAKVERIVEVMRTRESLGRSDLRALDLDLHEDHYSGWGGIFSHLVRLGSVCHVAREGGEGRFAHRERWLPDLEWNPLDVDAANVELARRYFAVYGPATIDDFAYWRGMYVGPARATVAGLAGELTEVQVEGKPHFARSDQLEALAALPTGEADKLPVRMLFRFDPMLLGHRSRAWVVAPAFHKRVARPAGHIEGVVLHRGMAAAVWRYERKAGGLIVSVAPFTKLPAAVSKKLPKLAAGVAGFFALPLADLRMVESFD